MNVLELEKSLDYDQTDTTKMNKSSSPLKLDLSIAVKALEEMNTLSFEENYNIHTINSSAPENKEDVLKLNTWRRSLLFLKTYYPEKKKPSAIISNTMEAENSTSSSSQRNMFTRLTEMRDNLEDVLKRNQDKLTQMKRGSYNLTKLERINLYAAQPISREYCYEESDD